MGTHADALAAPPASLRLTRRLIAGYWAVGLAAVLTSILLAFAISLYGSPGPLVADLATVAITLLLLGAWFLRAVLHVPCTIEHQLRGLTAGERDPCTLEPIRAAGPVAGAWNGIVAALQDQQAQSDLEQTLQEKLGTAGYQRWESALDSLCEGIALTDAQGHVEAANKTFTAIFETSAEAPWEGTAIVDLFARKLGDPASPLLPTLAAASGAYICDLPLGSETSAGVLRVQRLPVIDGEYVTASAIWTIRDVTQQRLAEEMRNQFVSTATHELRTPLANIKAYAETLAMNPELDPENQKDFYNIINREASRLSRFIDELLDLNQMEAGAVTLVQHETDLPRLLHEVGADLQPQIKQKQLEFECVLPAKLPPLALDKDKVSAAITNLLGNAIKYTPEGGKVRTLVELSEEELQIHIEDTGIGIAADQLARIGEKFFRANDQRLEEIPGSGLGVAFAQEVARVHGGRLQILSEWDKGSRFSLILPLRHAKRGSHV